MKKLALAVTVLTGALLLYAAQDLTCSLPPAHPRFPSIS
jgi:hypothetical protein